MNVEYNFSSAKKATQIDHLNRLREEQARLLDVDVKIGLPDKWLCIGFVFANFVLMFGVYYFLG